MEYCLKVAFLERERERERLIRTFVNCNKTSGLLRVRISGCVLYF